MISLMQPEVEVYATIEPDPYAGMAEVPCYGVLAPEGIPSGDDPQREFAPGSLDWAPLPISFKWQEKEDEGHGGACVTGRIDAIWRDGALIRWTGAVDNVGEYGRELIRMRVANFVRGVSIMADDTMDTDIEYVYPIMPPMPDVAVPMAAAVEPLDDDPNLLPTDEQNMAPAPFAPPSMPMMDMEEMCEPIKLIFHHARIRSATVVAEPAFVEATFELGESPIPVPMQTNPGTPGEMPEEVVVASVSSEPSQCGTIDPNWRGGPTVITAAAASWTITIPEVWPESWFEEPAEAPPIGALNITAAGRIYGYLAPGNVSHRGFRAQGRAVYAPSGIDYSEFQNKGCIVAGADGQVYKINAGNVTFDCGHASPMDPRRADPSWAAAHYENSCSIAARVRVGENRNGTWVAGALLHGITPDTVERMMACALSGDWQDGKLKGALLVPVEGFPRAQTASVRIREDAMVASSVPIHFQAPPPGPNLRPALERLARAIGRDRATLTASAFEQLRQRAGR
jgi:hypothetical protein